MNDLMHNRRLLLISADFPPDSSPGAIRNSALARHLSGRFTDVKVLTENHVEFGMKPTWRFVDKVEDFSAMRRSVGGQKPSPLKILMAKIFYFLDSSYSGIDFAYRLTTEAHQTTPFDLVYASCNPLSVAVIGYRLKKALQVPLVIEMRDPWIENPMKVWPSYWHYLAERRLARRILESADAIVMNSPTARDMLLQSPLKLSEKRVHVIPHGFDCERLQSPSLTADNREASASRNVFSVGYSGGFYASCRPKRRSAIKRLFQFTPFSANTLDLDRSSPKPLLDAITIAHLRRPDLRDRLHLNFLGTLGREDVQYIHEQGLQSYVTDFPRTSPDKVPQFVSNCSALYLSNPIFSNLRSPFISTKTIEYLTFGKPVIVFLSSSDNQDILLRAGIGRPVKALDAERLAEVIIEMADSFFSGDLNTSPDHEFISHFRRSHQAEILTNIFSQVVGDSEPEAQLTSAFQPNWNECP